MNIYVGNLAKDVTDEELQNLFAEYGYIKSVKIIRDLFSGESKGFGFVEMPGVAEAQKAIDSCNTKDLKGKKIVVNEARPKTENSRRGGGGGRGGGCVHTHGLSGLNPENPRLSQGSRGPEPGTGSNRLEQAPARLRATPQICGRAERKAYLGLHSGLGFRANP